MGQGNIFYGKLSKLFIYSFVALAIAWVCILRFWHFPQNPPSLNWDEVSFGYNAYSVLKTGKDEFGEFLPSIFRSLDDYKLPVYMYATVLSEWIFGLNDFAVRFPSALSGLITVVVVYFLTREVVGSMQETKGKKRLGITGYVAINPTNGVSFLAAFLLGILPWHIQFSRMAAEANMGLLFFTLGLYLFIKSTKNITYLPFCALSFALAMYTYLSFRVMVVLCTPILILVYWKNIIKSHWAVYLSASIGIIVSILLVHELLFSGVHIRYQGTNVFHNSFTTYKQEENEMFTDALLKDNLVRRVFHDSHFLTSSSIILSGYASHFSPNFLFFDYNQKHHHTPFVGLLYVWLSGCIAAGLYGLLRYITKKSATMLLTVLFMAPVPAAFTWDVPHAIRTLGMVIPLCIVSAIGIAYIYRKLCAYKNIQKVSIGIFFFIAVFSSFHFFHQYQIHLPQERSSNWIYGRKELATYLSDVKNKYDKIIVSSGLEWPYVFLLYYMKYDPGRYLAGGGTVSGGWGEEGNRFENFEFHKFQFSTAKGSRVLYVGKPDEFPAGVTPIKIIYNLDKTPALLIVEGPSV
jgi:4-amino-4-deoxy-L-arabinose transferase-like glycosyltransferase